METNHPTTASGMLLLNGLPVRTQITLDAHSEAYLTNDQFVGIKSLPAGWHCVSWSLASSDAFKTTSEDSAGTDQGTSYLSEGSIRHILLRWFDQAEVTVRELDRVQQRLVVPDQVTRFSVGSSIGRSHRRHLTRSLSLSSTAPVDTLITPDVLNRIEPRLLPYPPAAQAPWRHATHHLSHSRGRIGRAVVARVLGIDIISGDSATDSLATGPARAKDTREQASLRSPTAAAAAAGGRIEDGKIIWGKSRAQTERPASHTLEEVAQDGKEAADSRFEPGVVATAEPKKRKRAEAALLAETTGGKVDGEGEDDDSLQFTSFDLRRSWPPFSVGAEITRWSEDKSWLLQDVARRSWSNLAVGSTTLDAAMDTETETGEMFVALLCEFELAFVLFVAAGNSYAWEQWRELLTLFCRASSLIGAPSAFQLHPSITAPGAEACSAMNDVRLDAHVAFLTALQAQLSLLDSTFWTDQASAVEEAAVQTELGVLRANIARALADAAARSNSQTDTGQPGEQQSHLVKAWRRLSHSTSAKFGWQLDRRLDEEAEVEDDLDAEDGEDAPVIVET